MPSASRIPKKARTEVVSKACTQCRKRKIKCSGDRPRCFNCEKQAHECHYDQERKDRLRDALRRSHALAALLVEVSPQLNVESKKAVENLLASFDDDTLILSELSALPSRYKGKRPRRASLSYLDGGDQNLASAEGGESLVTASVASNEDLDFIQEDLLQSENINKTGFMGRNSQAQLLRALEVKVEQPEGEPPDMPYGPPGASSDAFNQRAEALHRRQQKTKPKSASRGYFTDYYFYLDNSDIETNDSDPHIVPSGETAERLFEYYKVAVHSPFRLLDDVFEAQLHVYYGKVQEGVTLNVCSKWKAVMNLVFAIGARYCHMIGVDWQAEDCNHLVYMWRAVHLLELETFNTLVSRPNQLLIQATGLLSFYYITIGHVSRAWDMIGISIRHAQAAGLHLRHEDPSVTVSRKKTTARMWWALYSIECLLTAITGRPRVVATKDCTVAPPGAAASNLQEQPTSASVSKSPSSGSRGSASSVSTPGDADIDTFEVAYVSLDILMDKILSKLYSARNSTNTWKQAQMEINSLSEELDAWALRSLARGPFVAVAALDVDLSREQMLLYLYYQNAKICLTRPCLCRLDQRIKGQSEASARLNQKMAEACINAALDITSLLPEQTDPRWFYERGPWWSATHIIMQGLTVLLMELSLGGVHLTVDKSYVTACAQKLIKWLKSMAPMDGVSERAFQVVSKVLQKQDAATGFERDLPRPSCGKDYDQQQEHSAKDANLSSQQPIQDYNEATNPEQLDSAWPSLDAFDSNAFYSRSYPRNFYPNDLSVSEYLNDPNAGLFEFSQPQLSLFYGNPYSSNFDQWDFDAALLSEQGGAQLGDGQELGGENPKHGQEPDQGLYGVGQGYCQGQMQGQNQRFSYGWSQ